MILLLKIIGLAQDALDPEISLLTGHHCGNLRNTDFCITTDKE